MTGAAIFAFSIQFLTVINLILTVIASVTLGTVTSVLVGGVWVLLTDTGATVHTGCLGTCLDLEFFTILAFVLWQTLTGVVTRLHCLCTRGTIQTRSILTLILVLVTFPASPARVTGTRVVTHPVHTRAMVTLVIQTLVNVDTAGGAHEARCTGALKLFSWIRADSLVLTLLLVTQDTLLTTCQSLVT